MSGFLKRALDVASIRAGAAPTDADQLIIGQGPDIKRVALGVVRTDIAASAAASAAASTQAAQTAKASAEAARDAAAVAGKVYATTAAGLAATVNGDHFSVPSADSAEFLILYRNNAGAAVEVKRYPSVAAFAAVDSLRVNSGRAYPLRQMTRAGVTSVEDSRWNNLLLDVKVTNAREGEYYQIAYLQNEAALDGESTMDWIIYAFDAATFETVGTPIILTSYLKAIYGAQQQVIRTGGIQTITLKPTSRPEMRFDITVDASKLPPAGQPINSNSSSAEKAWSWIIDPSRYFYEDARLVGDAATGRRNAVRWEWSGDSVYMSFASGTAKLYRVKIGPTGFNALPNIAQIAAAPMGALETAVFTAIASYTTDWLPPMIVRAVNNGDAGPMIYTGGNHGSDGASGGTTTARNIAFQVLPDGVPTAPGKTGYCAAMRILIVNELMGYNTITAGRYVLRQAISLTIRAGEINVSTEVTALEPISVVTDNGPQLVTEGFRGTQIFSGGDNTARAGYNNFATSGTKAVAPNAFALVLKHNTNGQLAMWVDRTYGHGDGRNVPNNAPMLRGGTGTNHKFYSAIVAGISQPLETGASYRWRGGYALQAPSLVPASIDSFFACHRGGEPVFVTTMPNGTFSIA